MGAVVQGSVTYEGPTPNPDPAFEVPVPCGWPVYGGPVLHGVPVIKEELGVTEEDNNKGRRSFPSSFIDAILVQRISSSVTTQV